MFSTIQKGYLFKFWPYIERVTFLIESMQIHINTNQHKNKRPYDKKNHQLNRRERVKHNQYTEI